MINLLPLEVKQNIAYAKRNNVLLHFCLFALGIGSFLAAIYGYQYLILSQDYKIAQQEYETKNSTFTDSKTVTDAQNLSSTISTATTLLNRERKFSVFIKQIGSLLPEGAYLSNLSLSNDTKQPLQIEAVALNESQALIIKKNIEDITDDAGKKIFNGADIQNIAQSTIKINDKETVRYTVRITTAFADKTTTTTSTKPSDAKNLTSADLVGEKKK